jgi:two-component system chemotaxis response regulator CheB
MPPIFTASFAESLARKCPMRVVEAQNEQVISQGTAYIAPGGKQMKVKRATNQTVQVVITDDPPENHCRPSVDTLFRSMAHEYGGQVLAAILTGMGKDGVSGMKLLKEVGASTIAQDEATCAVFGMPQEAIRAGIVDRVLPLDQIARAIVGALRNNGS